MWPNVVDWKTLKYGVEIEFVEGDPEKVNLLPGWTMALNEKQIDDRGCKSGSELQSPPLSWGERGQIRVMLDRLKENGAIANWSCGLHVHIGLEPWDEAIVDPLVDAALTYQSSLQSLLHTAEQRLIYCPPLTKDMYRRFKESHSPLDLRQLGRPQSHRCGINVRPWYEIGTVEIRYANGTLAFNQVEATIELCLRFVAAIGKGAELPIDPVEFAFALGAPCEGYPPPIPVPQWYRERIWLETMLLPVFQPLVEAKFPSGEILEIIPAENGISITGEDAVGEPFSITACYTNNAWRIKA